MIRALSIFLALPLVGGCYAYAPSGLGEVSSGDQVRARLTAAQFDEFAEILPTDDRDLQGTVVEAGPSGILLEVPVVTVLEGIRVESFHQRLRVPAAGLADLELRSLNRPKTYLVSGFAAAVVGFVIWDQLLSETGRSPGDPPDSPEEDRRTVFKLPLIVW